MTTPPPIKTLFANDIHRRIEEVIKVDQTDESILHEELDEYVLTDAIRLHYKHILRSYWETPNKPHEGIAVWVSGFFGSGKSSFAKMLGLSLQNRPILGKPASEIFGSRSSDTEMRVLLKQIAEHIRQRVDGISDTVCLYQPGPIATEVLAEIVDELRRR